MFHYRSLDILFSLIQGFFFFRMFGLLKRFGAFCVSRFFICRCSEAHILQQRVSRSRLWIRGDGLRVDFATWWISQGFHKDGSSRITFGFNGGFHNGVAHVGGRLMVNSCGCSQWFVVASNLVDFARIHSGPTTRNGHSQLLQQWMTVVQFRCQGFRATLQKQSQFLHFHKNHFSRHIDLICYVHEHLTPHSVLTDVETTLTIQTL